MYNTLFFVFYLWTDERLIQLVDTLDFQLKRPLVCKIWCEFVLNLKIPTLFLLQTQLSSMSMSVICSKRALKRPQQYHKFIEPCNIRESEIMLYGAVYMMAAIY